MFRKHYLLNLLGYNVKVMSYNKAVVSCVLSCVLSVADGFRFELLFIHLPPLMSLARTLCKTLRFVRAAKICRV